MYNDFVELLLKTRLEWRRLLHMWHTEQTKIFRVTELVSLSKLGLHKPSVPRTRARRSETERDSSNSQIFHSIL